LTTLVGELRAVAEPSRLRLLALLARSELTVTDLTGIVGQSQPRVSRHLKLLCEAGLIERLQEGAHVFYRLGDRGPGRNLTRALLRLVPADDPVLARDRQRLRKVQGERAARAAEFFRDNAPRWAAIRSLYVDEAEIEAAMLEAAGDEPIDTLVDLGTGTGRVLELFSPRIRHGIGIDRSREMLALARAQLEARRARHCQVRLGDLYHLELPAGSADVVTLRHVLHFLEEPAPALAEAARLLRPRGRLIVVDFAPHHLERLRSELRHRRLGFADEEVAGWCRAAGLTGTSVRHLPPPRGDGEARLTVSLWTGRQRPDALAHHILEVA